MKDSDYIWVEHGWSANEWNIVYAKNGMPLVWYADFVNAVGTACNIGNSFGVKKVVIWIGKTRYSVDISGWTVIREHEESETEYNLTGQHNLLEFMRHEHQEHKGGEK